ncbi:MAG: hypothetical protein LBT79_00305 [Elusimicrobiota bacterium]|jgi:hypothetical protein|nr:hypothetical protein [Elusimicrobiota bacterium]
MISTINKILRIFKKVIWEIACLFRKAFILRIIKAMGKQAVIKIVPSPFFIYSKFKLLNPFTWLKIICNKDKNFADINFYASQNEDGILKVPTIPKRGHIYYNLNRIIKDNPQINRFGLLFFLTGIGDYFSQTSFIQVLKKEYPRISMDAFVARSSDGITSPLIGKLLETNPLIENIYYYEGKIAGDYFKNYDHCQVYKMVNVNTLLLPMICENNKLTKSRLNAMRRTFMMRENNKIVYPIINISSETSKNVSYLLNKLESLYCKKHYKGIIFMQMTGASSKYTYPHTDILMKKFINEGYFVLTSENIKIDDENQVNIDIKKININETIQLLSILKQKYPLFFVCIASCFLAISSGLGIKMLCLYHFEDEGIRAVWFPNIYCILYRDYIQLPKNHIFIANQNNFTCVNNDDGKKVYNYNPDFVIDCFKQIKNNKEMSWNY